MEIRQNQGRGLSYLTKSKEGEAEKLSGLKKSEVINDLFNNRRNSEQEKEAFIQLSKTSKNLQQNLEDRLKDFFKKEKELAKLMEKMPLSEGLFQNKGGTNLLRKTRAYLQWVKIHQETIEEPAEEEPHLALEIHKMGKDPEIKALFEENDVLRQRINEQRKKNTLNYYYMVYPETYSFN